MAEGKTPLGPLAQKTKDLLGMAEEAHNQAMRLEEKGIKAASTHCRNVLQKIKVIAQDGRVAAQHIRRSLDK